MASMWPRYVQITKYKDRTCTMKIHPLKFACGPAHAFDARQAYSFRSSEVVCDSMPILSGGGGGHRIGSDSDAIRSSVTAPSLGEGPSPEFAECSFASESD